MLTFIKTLVSTSLTLLALLPMNQSVFAQSIFWSGAYANPHIGKVTAEEGKKMAAEMAKRRSNHKQSLKIDRLVIARSGDVAYEYGTFNLQFDTVPDNKHVDHDGAYLRTWRKEKGEWLVDAAFMRPFGNMSIVAEK
jgi:hypothetical protein